MGTSADLKVGQSVYAIGTPLGFSRTLTVGVVSGLNRAIPSPAGTITRGAIQASCSSFSPEYAIPHVPMAKPGKIQLFSALVPYH